MFVSVEVFEVVGAEQSAVAVCEVDDDEGREVCGDVTVAVGADDADTITGVEGHGRSSVEVFEFVPVEPVVATDWTRRCITRVSYFEPHAVVGPRVAVSNLDHLAGTAVVLVERHDFHPVTDRELRHVPDSSIWSLPSTS